MVSISTTEFWPGDKNSHSNAGRRIRGVPEADVAGIDAPSRRVPRHNDKECLEEDIENDERIPGPEGRAAEADSAPPPPHHVQADGHDQVEEGVGKDLEIDDWLSVSACTLHVMGTFNLLKLKASPAGGARIMSTVKAHLTAYGPRGVPSGRVEAQKRGHGRTPCL